MANPIGTILPKNKVTGESIARLVSDEDKAIEKILDGIVEMSDGSLAKARVTRPLTEAACPEGSLVLTRVLREIDDLLGPGRSVLQVLTARYVKLQSSLHVTSRLLRLGRRTRTQSARQLVITMFDRQLKEFSVIKGEILRDIEKSVDAVAKRLQAQTVGQRATKVRKDVQTALDEAEQQLQNQRKVLTGKIEDSSSAITHQKRDEAHVTMVMATKDTGARAFINSRIKRLMQFPKGREMAADFGKELKNKVRHFLPILDEVEDSAPFFMEALGIVASANGKGTRLLRSWAQGKTKIDSVSGYLAHMKGILPEEVVTRMKFLESIFHKNAFEILSEFPPKLRGQMSVEIVEGPLWVIVHSGAPRQFGDSCMLLTGPNGQAAIIGLAEVKAGFDEDLLKQLFARSDARALNSSVTFIDRNGKSQVRKLTREFSFEGGEAVPINKPPTYVYGRTKGEKKETAEEFQKLVNDQMRRDREVWKVPLPLSLQQNQRFSEQALREAVKAIVKADPNWGL